MGASRDAVTANGLRRIYRILAFLAASDGEVDGTERARLDRFRRDHGISPQEARALELESREKGNLKLSKRTAELRQLIDEALAMVAADGVFADGERAALRGLARVIGIDPDELTSRADAFTAGFDLADAPPLPGPKPKRGAKGGRVLKGRLVPSPAPAAEAAPLLEDIGPAPAATPGAASGRLVILNAEALPRILVSGAAVAPAAQGGAFLGVRGLRCGWHRVDAAGSRAWVRVRPEAAGVLGWHEGALLAPQPAEMARLAADAAAGLMDNHLFPAEAPPDWAPVLRALFRPLEVLESPPQVHANPAPGQLAGGPFEANLIGLHRGSPEALLAELAFVFLDGVADAQGARAASELSPHTQARLLRWHGLLQALFLCEGQAAAWPGLLIAAVELLTAQLTAFTRPAPEVMALAGNLGAVMMRAPMPQVAAAGQAWLAFLDSRGWA